ncbi:ATP-binding protein [Streptomyces olivaceus]|uniref:ATP-binding protein n=1 Tax=Streptomyces olivaceus TaxID=47716 RepID=UPI001CCF8AE3|nr:ATP-binding protein [Streptomyces olivaceus]MBZ6171307.1 ATP-binding protein [Streptomyces olivaceus]MBZ6178275.1 ATP-binding protein [Streptomyces olivaceus]
MASRASLRFSPEILRRLGEELVPHPDLGVIELVRNAYDADAPTCSVEMHSVESRGGRIVVTDTGDGMSEDDIISGWLLLGKSTKAESPFTRNGRRKVGEKGLGRLAALRLGRSVTLTTRPRETPGVQHTLRIDWRSFDAVAAVEDVQLTITTVPTDAQPGTEIEINDLTTAFKPKDVERLARALVLLTGPFPGPADFRVDLNAPEFQKLASIVHQSFFDDAEYRIIADLNENGRASATLYDWRGEEIAAGGHSEVSSAGSERGESPLAYFTPAAHFELWTFNLSANAFTVRGSKHKVSEVRNWLRSVGGVHLYHRNLRVHPYGDEGHDWLDMNLRRVRSPELRPGTNTSVGRVSVIDEEQRLTPKTDRTGFLETPEFVELARFGRNVLDWAAKELLRRREAEKGKKQQQAGDKIENAIARLQDTVNKLPPQQRREVLEATNFLRSAFDEKVRAVEDDLLLYRTLSTVGTTTAVFAHETRQPVDLIDQASGVIARRAARLLKDDYETQLSGPVDTVRRAADSLRTYADIPLRLLQRRKRRASVVDVNDIATDIVGLFGPHLAGANISVELQLADGGAPVKATVAGIEAILANLLANATYVFTQPHDGGTPERLIVLKTDVNPDSVFLTVMDNGPGIDTARLAIEDIWLPGATTREDGTGLGLTIVRDATSDLKGEVFAKPMGEIGGAEFNIQLPRATSSS